MKIPAFLKSGSSLLVLIGLTACATTTMQKVDSEPVFHSGQIHRVLVINMGTSWALRVKVEDEFVRQWRELGVDAVSSHSVLAPGEKIEKTTVSAAARLKNFDSVLVTRLVESQQIDPQIRGEDFEIVPSTGLASGTTEYDKPVVASPEYARQYRMASVTTRVYETRTEKRVWSGFSQTLIAKDVSKLIKPFVKTVLRSLYQTP